MKKVRVRFAPSPTGDIHIGNARTALFNYLYAKNSNGTFVLRIEDTDRKRSEKVYEESIISDLKWLGIEYDEGPDKNGGFGPYNQFERLQIYDEFKEKLIKKGFIYKCFCQPEFLEKIKKEQIKRKEPPRYPGICSNLTEKEIDEKEKSGIKPVYRFKVGKGKIEYNDMVYGKISFLAQNFGDFIVIRSDGIPAYNFAAVIDDALMKISHVIRGEDHISNTPLQILLGKAIGFDVPQFAHFPLLLGEDRAPLSKRVGSVSIKAFRQSGILPEALVHYMVFLGASIIKDEILPFAQIVKRFSFDKISRKGAAFDFVKLSWFNKQSLKRMNEKEIANNLTTFIEQKYLNSRYLLKAIEHGKKQAENLVELAEIISPFIKDSFTTQEKIILNENEKIVLEEFYKIIENSKAEEEINYPNVLKEVSNNTHLRGRELYHPIRLALTGMEKGFEMESVFSILPLDEIKKRLKAALNKVG